MVQEAFSPAPDRGRFPGSIDFKGRCVHLIGIGGCGMSGVARMLLHRGAQVTGSDRSESSLLQVLCSEGATVYIGHEGRNVPDGADLVVASAAIPDDNAEMIAARAQGRPIIKYADLLGMLMADMNGVAIAGTHGKSTATAMTTWCCSQAGLQPSFVVGAEVPQLGGGAGICTRVQGQAVAPATDFLQRQSPFVVEACEYDCSFLKLAPTHAAVLNIEEDHLDYFEDLDHIVRAFRSFGSLVPPNGMLLYNQDDPVSVRTLSEFTGATSFGMQPGATWRAKQLGADAGLPRFELIHQDRSLGTVQLSIPGAHNVYNAIASAALAITCGGDPAAVLAALGSFRGVCRRLTHRGAHAGIDILDDYAHHPTEIRASLRAVKARFPRRRIRAVFQPHQHSRTRFFLQDFAESFELADEVFVPDIYFVRDSVSESQLVSSGDLVERIQDNGGIARYIPSLDDLAEELASSSQPGDVVLTMGAGDVWKVADEMVLRLRVDN